MRRAPPLPAALLAAACLLAFGSLARAQDDPEPLPVGAEAPAFELPATDGETYSLEDFSEAEVLAIIFMCNHCPTSQAYEARIKELAADFGDRGVAVVGISPNDPDAIRLDELGYTDLSDTVEEMKIRAEDHGFNFTYLYDGDRQDASRRYGPVATPHAFVFGPDRTLRYRGRIDDSENPRNVSRRDTRRAIEAILAGESIQEPARKAFGCSIKWAGKQSSVEEANEDWRSREVGLERIGVDGLSEVVTNPTDRLRVINVWATWCGPCVAEFPDLVEIARMYRNRSFEFVTLSADGPENMEKARTFLERQEAALTNYLFDSEDRYAMIDAVDPEWPGALPYTVVVAPDGEVVYREMGTISPLELKREIVDYLGRYYFSEMGDTQRLW